MVVMNFRVTEEEKRKLDVAKAKSDASTWREFFLKLVDEKEAGELEGDER